MSCYKLTDKGCYQQCGEIKIPFVAPDGAVALFLSIGDIKSVREAHIESNELIINNENLPINREIQFMLMQGNEILIEEGEHNFKFTIKIYV